MKRHYFQGNDDCNFEPMCGIAGIAKSTAYSTGHLIVASICHSGPGPGFFAPSIYKYITGALKELLKDLPKELSLGSFYSKSYKEVSLF